MTTYSLTGTQAALVSLAAGTVSIQIEGTWTGTINFNASLDYNPATGVGTWEAIAVTPILPSGGSAVSSTTANGTWQVAVNAIVDLQIIGATITGTATVVVNQSIVSLPGTSSGGGGGGTVTQGTAAAISAPWPVELSNGTNAVGTSGAPVYVESVSGSVVALAAGAAAIGTVTQGTAAAISAPWPVELSNGTNAVGTAGAPVFVEVTNGTQNMPTGDAQARAIQVTPGDGTHTTPAGDAVSRARYSITTDGTNVAAVKAASTAPVAADNASVVAISPNAPAFSQTASIGTVSAVLKASAGVLKSVFAANRSTVPLWLQFQNQTTAITNAGNAVLQFYVPPNGEIVIGSDFFVGAGWAFSTGISWGFSTLTTTYTAYGTAANVDFQGMFL